MKVLVVGQGGREHVLAWKLAQSPRVTQVYCAPGNAGTALEPNVENVDISSSDIDGITKFAVEQAIDLTVVGPEAPLVAGLVDLLREKGLRVFGPTKAAAELEGSKAFSKQVMKHAGVPTADFKIFHDAKDAFAYLEEREAAGFVVKADGLAAGKGVMVCNNREEAMAAVKQIAVDRAFGESGSKFVIEEKLVGQEVSILAIVDGKSIVPLDTSQDHKRAHDGDSGSNTGGMGAYSPAPIVSAEMMDQIVEKILIPTVHEMKRRGTPFQGVLYAGLMLTAQGPKVLEYNVRFGDPEAQPVLMRLKTDLFSVLNAAANGDLKSIADLDWDPRPAVCVVMASEGYPGSYEKGRPIRGLDAAAEIENAKVFHAGTALKGEEIVNDGGRVLGVTALGETISEAKLRAYSAVKPIRWEGAWCRKDISDKARLSE
ncbi:phosphoribosylamine--glycine ligase [Calycomorphotria hydatis]|uniref:Phosphoribosylamine--glycine ligase n=1 Tax=Calycomorphotria hydatis TaxID=2528027 RepID=A0A517T9E2_9PLAN|nr:phosphoribosylamine--glycine ligase [Calycomorphotria hydatis]QDT64978.1 Phosphoribosylamine--glycine ligase [Calycomorphotria hydatis]